jgi:hypothetical protein
VQQGEISSRGSGGFLGACNAPVQRFIVMVQRNAAGVWSVPRFLSSSPKIGGVDVEYWGNRYGD